MIQKYQDDTDLQATVAIFDIENKLSSRDPKGACAVFPRIEKILRDSRLDSRVTLTARYLAARARVLQLLDGNGEIPTIADRNGEAQAAPDRNGMIPALADRNGEAQAVSDWNGKIPAVADRNGEAQAVPDRAGEDQASHLPDRDWEPHASQLLDRNGEVQAVQLHVSSGTNDARTLYQQSVGLCELGQPDPFSHPYVLHIYSTVSLLHPHRNRASGLITLPDECTWQAVEKFKLRACEGQLALLDILEEDPTIPETTARYFLLWKVLKYCSALLRSCHAAGFLFFDQMPCPKRNIPKAKECLSSLRRSRHLMTARSRVEYYCIKCDYYLRLANFETACSNKARNYVHKAEKCIRRAQASSSKCGKDLSMTKSFCQYRHNYVISRLSRADWHFCSGQNRGQYPEHCRQPGSSPDKDQYPALCRPSGSSQDNIQSSQLPTGIFPLNADVTSEHYPDREKAVNVSNTCVQAACSLGVSPLLSLHSDTYGEDVTTETTSRQSHSGEQTLVKLRMESCEARFDIDFRQPQLCHMSYQQLHKDRQETKPKTRETDT